MSPRWLMMHLCPDLAPSLEIVGCADARDGDILVVMLQKHWLSATYLLYANQNFPKRVIVSSATTRHRSVSAGAAGLRDRLSVCRKAAHGR